MGRMPTTAFIKREARARLASLAFDLKPTEAAIKTLPNRRRRLHRSAKGFRLERPSFCLGAISLTGSFGSSFAGTKGTSECCPGSAGQSAQSAYSR